MKSVLFNDTKKYGIIIFFIIITWPLFFLLITSKVTQVST